MCYVVPTYHPGTGKDEKAHQQNHVAHEVSALTPVAQAQFTQTSQPHTRIFNDLWGAINPAGSYIFVRLVLMLLEFNVQSLGCGVGVRDLLKPTCKAA